MVKPQARSRSPLCDSLCSRAAAVSWLGVLVLVLVLVLLASCCFLAAAVNITVTNNHKGFGPSGFDGSDAWLREDRMDAIELKKLRGRCFVVEGEEEGEERHRCHPNIFFFGVSKCGTTSMAKWMTKHPQLRWVSRVKTTGVLTKPGQEARALQLNKYKTEEEFAHAYPLTAPEADEADPVVDYVPYLINELYGELAYNGTVKYVVFLREPAARTASSWQFKYDLEGIERGSKGGFLSERRSLKEAFEEGSRRINALVECRSKYLPSQLYSEIDLKTCKPGDFLEVNPYFSHVGKSMYALQIGRWVRLFGRDNVKVIFLEEVAADPLGELSKVFDFLGMELVDKEGKKGRDGLQEWEEIVKRIRNTANSRKTELLGPQVTPELLQSMRDFFAPHNAELAELLGRPLPGEWSLPCATR
eukprot:g12271.t1